MLVYSQNGPESRLGSVYIYLYPYLFQYIMMMPRNLYFGVITFWGLPVSCICTSRGVAKGGAFENFNYGRRVKMGGLKRRTFLHVGGLLFYSTKTGTPTPGWRGLSADALPGQHAPSPAWIAHNTSVVLEQFTMPRTVTMCKHSQKYKQYGARARADTSSTASITHTKTSRKRTLRRSRLRFLCARA